MRGLALLALAALAGGCAVNLSEARPARVLRGGEMQVSQVNNVVVPTRVAGDLIAPAKTIARAIEGGREPTPDEKRALAGSAVAIALTGPGFGSHVDFGIGLGYRLDVSARMGNGIYAASLRRGFDLGRWQASLGARAGYNSGSAFVPYLDEINDFVKVSEMRRFDGQLFGQIGREFREWVKIWAGAKAMWSPYHAAVDGSRAGLGSEVVDDHLVYYGGFVGFAVGFRWFHVVAELSVLQTSADVTLFGERYDLSGVTFAPTWGYQGTF